MKRISLLLASLFLVTTSGGVSPSYMGYFGETGTYPSHDWLSSDIGLITYYGPGYPVAIGSYDNRMFYDEWYPVARAFLDGTTYGGSYYSYSYSYPVHIDGSWWKDPRGYRPLYKVGSGIYLSNCKPRYS